MANGLEQVGVDAFEGTRLRRSGVVAVAFLAEWCPFCQAFWPEFARLAETGPIRLLVADVTDTDSPLWDRFALEVVPTVVVFREGMPGFRVDGVPGRGLSSTDLDAVARAAASASHPGGAGSRGRKK